MQLLFEKDTWFLNSRYEERHHAQDAGFAWDKKLKVWWTTDPLKAKSLSRFANHASIRAIESSTGDMRRNFELSSATSSDINVQGIDGQGDVLMPCQNVPIEYGINKKRFMIGDQQGIGKTIEGAIFLHFAKLYPAIIPCPSVAKLVWERELKKWTPNVPVVLINSKSDLVNLSEGVHVISYALLGRNSSVEKKTGRLKFKPPFDVLDTHPWKAVMPDESHFLKHAKSKRTKCVKRLCKGVEFIIPLTGTVIEKRPFELISQLDIMGRLDDFGGFWGFAKRYCGAFHDGFGWNFSGATNLDELHERLRSICYIRRTKSQVFSQMPPKRRAVIPVEIDNRPEYDRAEKDIIAWIRANAKADREFLGSISEYPESVQDDMKNERATSAGKKAQKAEALVRLVNLKKIAADGKIAAVKEWIDSFLETDEQLVVFGWHKSIVKCIADNYQCRRITGDVNELDRATYIEEFQQSVTKLISCNIKAGGIAITLTAASNVAFIEIGQSAGQMDQAEDRVHRYGQDANVTAWYFIAVGTVDVDNYDLLEEEFKVMAAVSDGIQVDNADSGSIDMKLIKRLGNK